MRNDFKNDALILAVISLVIRLLFLSAFALTIGDWWGALIGFYFIVFIPHILTIVSTRVRNSVSENLSQAMFILSIIFLVFDGLMIMGLLASLNSEPFYALGIMPVCDFLNIQANCMILEGCKEVRNRCNGNLQEYDAPPPEFKFDEAIAKLQNADTVKTIVEEETTDTSDETDY
ncbi:MAG: hypothetical protein K6E66_08290 [Lachnospiraceae bacterium]|nr:hypothetical protein [Lachnospiraceae bacterium]